MKFAANVGTADRIIRILLGLLLVGLVLAGQIGLWGWLGVVLIATAFLKFCPAYALLGLRSCQDC